MRGLKSLTLSAMTVLNLPVFASPTDASDPNMDHSETSSESAENKNAKLEEIVVTAQKRTESLQTVPVAVTALSASTMTQKGVTQIDDLAAFVPGLDVWSGNGGGIPRFTLRGIGTQTDNQDTDGSVVVYMDEFALETRTTQSGQLFDLARVEVLRGPQGTLYGKNSTGGAINFITRRPDGSTEADGTVSVGRFGEYDVSAGAQTALADNVSIRVAVNRNYSDGYGFDVTTNKHTDGMDDWGTRIGLRYKTDNLDAFLKVFADGLDSAQQDAQVLGVNTADGSPRADNSNPITGFIASPVMDVFAQSFGLIHTHNNGVGLNLDYALGRLTLSSITGFVHSVSRVAEDVDVSPFRVADVPHYDISSEEVMQEVRLSSPSTDVLSWIAGSNFSHRTLHDDNVYDFSALGIPVTTQDFYQKDTSYAGYFDGTLKLGDQFSVVAGVRLTHDSKQRRIVSADDPFIGPFDVTNSHSWTVPTYRGVLNYQMDADTLFYLSYSHGYQAGAYDSEIITIPAQFNSVNPEYVENYEGGIKTTVFDQHLRLASAFYYTLFRDLQVAIPPPGGVCCGIVNAGKARIIGVDLEGTAIFSDNFDVNFEATYSSSKYLQFTNGTQNYAGASLGYLPNYKIKLSPEYRVPVKDGNFFLAPDVSVVGKSRHNSTTDAFGRDIQKAYAMVNAQVGFRADRGYSIYVWIKNATDKRVLTQFSDTSSFGFDSLIYGPPRTFGITVTARY